MLLWPYKYLKTLITKPKQYTVHKMGDARVPTSSYSHKTFLRLSGGLCAPSVKMPDLLFSAKLIQ